MRTFGYGDDLGLKEDFLQPKFIVPQDCSVELSFDGYQFLTDIFQAFDKDKDGALNDKELQDLFSTSPGIPWDQFSFPDSTITLKDGSPTLQGFMGQWRCLNLTKYK